MKKGTKAQSPKTEVGGRKSEIRGQKSEVGIEQLLKDAGFSKVRKINDRVIHATLDPKAQSLKPNAFSAAHAAFLQAACKHPALIGCSRFDTVPEPVLIVHRRAVPAEVRDQKSEVSEPGTENSEPSPLTPTP
jgi:hypothetical protein